MERIGIVYLTDEIKEELMKIRRENPRKSCKKNPKNRTESVKDSDKFIKKFLSDDKSGQLHCT